MNGDTIEEMKESLRPLLTDVFLATLAEAVRVYGSAKNRKFVEWCFQVAEKTCPTLELHKEAAGASG